MRKVHKNIYFSQSHEQDPRIRLVDRARGVGVGLVINQQGESGSLLLKSSFKKLIDLI